MTSAQNAGSGGPHFESDLPPTCLHAVCSLANTLLCRFTQAERTLAVPLSQQKPVCVSKYLCGWHAATGKYARSHVPNEEATVSHTHAHASRRRAFLQEAALFCELLACASSFMTLCLVLHHAR